MGNRDGTHVSTAAYIDTCRLLSSVQITGTSSAMECGYIGHDMFRGWGLGFMSD